MFKQSRRKPFLGTLEEGGSTDSELQTSVTSLSAEPAPAGLVLLDGRGGLLYLNSVAEAVLCYPDTRASNGERKTIVADKLRLELLPLCCYSHDHAELVSGRRTYVCRTLLLEPESSNGQGPTTAIVLERRSRRNDGLRRMCEQFNLTRREREAVLLLIDGLTTKEIAQRMDISPNTVKAFLRLVMTKLGATTRSGIVGKINHKQL